MRSMPQSGFSLEIQAISALTSPLRCGRPSLARDFQVPYRRQPFRCQRVTVSGRTTRRCWRQPSGQTPCSQCQWPTESIHLWPSQSIHSWPVGTPSFLANSRSTPLQTAVFGEG